MRNFLGLMLTLSLKLTSLRWSLELSASWQSLGIPGPCNCSDALPLSSLVPASRPCNRNSKGHHHIPFFQVCLTFCAIIQLPGLASRVSVWNYVCNGYAWNCFWCDARCACYSVLCQLLASPPLSTTYATSWHYFYQLILLHSENRKETRA